MNTSPAGQTPRWVRWTLSLLWVGLALGALCLLPAMRAPRTKAVVAAGWAERSGAAIRYTEPMTTPTLPEPSETPTSNDTTPTTVPPTNTPTTRVPTPGPTTPPKPSYLPVTLRDPSCTPEEQHVNVVFVMDGSSYMKKTHGGRKSIEIAQDIIRAWLDVMDFTPNAAGRVDRAGIVVFRERPQPRQGESLPVSTDKDKLRKFVDDFELGTPADKTRMDTALITAHDMLLKSSSVPRDGNKSVIVFISEMQAKGVPYENEAGCEDESEECTVLKRAKEVKGAGITLVVHATDNANRGDELMAMASTTSLAIVRPSNAQIAENYATLAPRKPCASNLFWPYRH